MKASLFALAAAAGFAAAEITRCGTLEPNDTVKASLNEAYYNAGNLRELAIQAVSVNTYVHIVTTQAKAGQYTRAQAQEQVCI